MGSQRFPFSKNRYFPGKRLRSADFARDQEFADHKLSFLSHWVFGTGVALGLGVQRLDSESLLVSPGFAVDALGRFLIVDEPAICRVRALKGLDSLHGETALLWLSYQEELTDPMFVPSGKGEVQEYAAARERFSLFLTGKDCLPVDAVDRELFSDTVLFEDDELRVRQVIPRVLTSQGIVQIRLVLESFYPEKVEIELHYAPLLPGFAPAVEGGEMELSRRLQLGKGETSLPLEVTLTTAAQAVAISLPESGFLLEKRGSQHRARRQFQEEFPVVPGDPIQALRERLLAQSPQALWEDSDAEAVPLAVLRFVRYDEKFLLDDVIPISDRLRVDAPYLQERLRQCGTFFPSPGAAAPAQARAAQSIAPAPAAAPVRHGHMTTGVVTLNAGLHLKEGKILYSDEITHNLGPGTVFVDFGVEDIYPAANSDRNRTDLLLGDVSLFTPVSGGYGVGLGRGVRVHADKGAFELAVRLNGELRRSTLRLRWFAWRPDENIPIREFTGTLIRLEPDVVYAAPGAVINFVPVFSSPARAPCDFWVPDKQAGLVTRDGVYTAPDKEGLYQVCAEIRDTPDSRVSAFVIVRTQADRAEHGPGKV